MTLHIDLTEFERFRRQLERMGSQYQQTLAAAGREAAQDILNQRGIQAYPPATEANRPGRTVEVEFGNGRVVTFRRAYYIRGRGLMVPRRGGRWELQPVSETYGKRWTVATDGYVTRVSNNASYAQYLGGDEQPEWMRAIGWRKLTDVARERAEAIRRVFEAWIRRLIDKNGL